MKYIIEHINGVLVKHDTTYRDPLKYIDRSFKSFDEFSNSLNLYFDIVGELYKPIKVITTEICFNHTGPYSKDGVYVGDHFDIWLTEKQKIRVGYRKERIIFQYVYKDYRGKWAYDWMLRYYDMKGSFLQWMKTRSKKDSVIDHTWERFFKNFNIEI